jgi:hypothetical protein
MSYCPNVEIVLTYRTITKATRDPDSPTLKQPALPLLLDESPDKTSPPANFSPSIHLLPSLIRPK